MNLKNFLTLTIKVIDFNLVAQQPELISKLRKLTLSPYSGLNFALDQMLTDVEARKVDCQIILARRFRTLVAWGIFSKEKTDFHFVHSSKGFDPIDGCMFQVYVESTYRRQGIASEIYKKAQKLAGDQILCVAPWDDVSTKFFKKFSDFKTKLL